MRISNPTRAFKIVLIICQKNAAAKSVGNILVDGFDKRRPVSMYKAIAEVND